MANTKSDIGTRTRTSLAIIITAALLMQIIFWVQYYYSRKEVHSNLERNAEMELVIKSMGIRNMLNDVSLALRNHRWEFEHALAYPDSLFPITRRIVEQNPHFEGCCIAMVPDYYPEKGHLFEPYTKRRGECVETVQLASERHDYSKNNDFIVSVEHDSSFWSEPYLDEDDPNVRLITYTFPVHDATGEVAGIVGIDYITDWLGEQLNIKHMFPSSFCLLISEKGQLICGPETEGDIHQEAEETLAVINDTTYKRNLSTSGRSTLLSFKDKDGDRCSVFYNSPKNLAPWKIAVVNYHDEVFEPLKKMRLINLLLTLAGLLIFAFIINRTANNLNKLQLANLEKERIDNELDIAKKIQMDMLPKSSSLLDRDDLDVEGLLVPAREVGGDLYYYFIRDEKLYFCIGDVSGKGVPASLVMAVTHSLFRSVTAHESNPARIMQTINENTCRGNDSNMFVTFFIGVLDLPTGKLRYCNAGHDNPIIVTNGLQLMSVKANLPLGVMESYLYVAEEMVLEPDTGILLYTDGLTEAKNKMHKQFRINRVMDVLDEYLKSHQVYAANIIDAVKLEVDDFVGDAEQSDDLTLLAIHYKPHKEKIVMTKSITLKNDVGEVETLNGFVKSVTETLHFEKQLQMSIKLALEEAVVNIMEYAYPAGVEGLVTVEAQVTDKVLQFKLMDDGMPFDPTEVSRADTTLSVEDRPIGGLGILLVRDLMDYINYERLDGKNILRLYKQLS